MSIEQFAVPGGRVLIERAIEVEEADQDLTDAEAEAAGPRPMPMHDWRDTTRSIGGLIVSGRNRRRPQTWALTLTD